MLKLYIFIRFYWHFWTFFMTWKPRDRKASWGSEWERIYCQKFFHFIFMLTFFSLSLWLGWGNKTIWVQSPKNTNMLPTETVLLNIHASVQAHKIAFCDYFMNCHETMQIINKRIALLKSYIINLQLIISYNQVQTLNKCQNNLLIIRICF